MHDSYNDFCYRQRQTCEAHACRDDEPCMHARRPAATLDGKRQSNQCAAARADASREARRAGDRDSDVALRAAHDIDMRKTSLERPEPDGYMPSLFSTD
ncbi:hypothetical protein [Burkholderia sp. SCN-KJ]|uniref:hypothetical protein n=1 Tax=Burkholderia sp. SCN-KJ TaxID=2969248 RepID=UPI00214F6A2F|nr:hypothetical protein [Burkholderia sp. SCN-KJ]MCR4466108.1 hypothetical protein [Burkholderia sp. SCN-KJ]